MPALGSIIKVYNWRISRRGGEIAERAGQGSREAGGQTGTGPPSRDSPARPRDFASTFLSSLRARLRRDLIVPTRYGLISGRLYEPAGGAVKAPKATTTQPRPIAARGKSAGGFGSDDWNL